VKRLAVSMVAVSLLLAGCRSGASGPVAAGPSPTAGGLPPGATSHPTPVVTASEPQPVDPDPDFQGTSERITGDLRDGIVGSSWHPGCPVALDDLRVLRLDRWGFDGKAHRGTLVVHRKYAQDVLRVFETLFGARFPIRRMRLVDAYGADDDRSMAANNTSAFNCRAVTGGSSWSQHSYGWAIDINPVQNPYVTSDGKVLPPAGAAYVDRSNDAKGLIRAGGVVVKAFTEIGWGWGGYWSSIKDYQHFSATGR
jgi:hypothetical protein